MTSRWTRRWTSRVDEHRRAFKIGQETCKAFATRRSSRPSRSGKCHWHGSPYLRVGRSWQQLRRIDRRPRDSPSSALNLRAEKRSPSCEASCAQRSDRRTARREAIATCAPNLLSADDRLPSCREAIARRQQPPWISRSSSTSTSTPSTRRSRRSASASTRGATPSASSSGIRCSPCRTRRARPA